MKSKEYLFILFVVALFTDNKLFIVLTAIPCIFYAMRVLIDVCKMRD